MGGNEGGTVLLSMTAPDGLLFEYFDENMKNGWTLSIAQYVESWKRFHPGVISLSFGTTLPVRG